MLLILVLSSGCRVTRHQRSLDTFGIHVFGFGFVKIVDGTNSVKTFAVGYMVTVRNKATVETNSQMTMNPK